MRVSEFRRFFQGAALAATIAAVGAVTPSYASAQVATDSAAVSTMRVDDDIDADDDTDLGWLGLLGLAGLLGLRRRDRVHHVDRVDRVDPVDTTRRM